MGIADLGFFSDLRVAREGLLSFGFWALQIHRFGSLRFRFSSKLVRYPIGGVHLMLSKMSEMFFGVEIGASAKIGARLNIEHIGCIVIHGGAVVGDDCVIRQGVTIGNKGGGSRWRTCFRESG